MKAKLSLLIAIALGAVAVLAPIHGGQPPKDPAGDIRELKLRDWEPKSMMVTKTTSAASARVASGTASRRCRKLRAVSQPRRLRDVAAVIRPRRGGWARSWIGSTASSSPGT